MSWLVQTDYPVALDSLDHQEPHGTKRDSFSNQRYCHLANGRLRETPYEPMWHLDIGCAGGGLVADMLRVGAVSIGLEGSDYNLKTGRAEWSRIPGRLFTCDVSRPFTIMFGGTHARFDLVTAWDVLEHIEENRLPGLVKNIFSHLRQGGLFHGTIPPENDEPAQDRYHQTMKPRSWWDELFTSNGFVIDEGEIALLKECRPRGEPWMVHAYRKVG